MFSASLFLVSRSTTFVRTKPSSISKDSISALSGEKFGRFCFCFCLGFLFVAVGGKSCGWKVRASGSRIEAASWGEGKREVEEATEQMTTEKRKRNFLHYVIIVLC